MRGKNIIFIKLISFKYIGVYLLRKRDLDSTHSPLISNEKLYVYSELYKLN